MKPNALLIVGDGDWRLVLSGPDGPRVGGVAGDGDASVQARSQAVRDFISAAGFATPAVLLALPSSWCLSVTVDTEGVTRRDRRRELAYRLEEHLPLATEDAVSDFCETGGHVLGVCAELNRLQPIVLALEAAGVAVGDICPMALLAAGSVARQQPEASAVLLEQASDCDLIEFRDHRPVRWSWLPDSQGVQDHLADWSRTAGTRARLAVLSSAGGCEIAAPPDVHVTRSEVDLDLVAADEASRVLSGAALPWIGLRRDALAATHRAEGYRHPIGILLAAAVVLLACVTVAAQWRGHRYHRLADMGAVRQAETFHRAFPEQPAPHDIVARLASERRKLAGIGGQSTEDRSLSPLPPSALAHLRRVLAALPRDIRYQLVDLSLSPGLIRIDGTARSHAEAEAIAVALRSGGYEVEPPKTQALDGGGVTFLFTAKPRDAMPRVEARR